MTFLKSLVVCLVLANAGYFLWIRGIAQSREIPIVPPPVATLTLASESAAVRPATTDAAGGSGGDIASGADTARESGPAGLPTNAMRCLSVGPFRDVAEAAHAATTLRAGGYDPRQRVEEGEVWAGIWVYLPGPANQPMREQALAKLKAAGIEDALEMPGPNDGSVISLGLFSESKRAQARVAQAHSLGFNPSLADRKRTGNVYWIDVDLKATDNMLNPADLQGEAGHIVRLEVKGCPSGPGAGQ